MSPFPAVNAPVGGSLDRISKLNRFDEQINRLRTQYAQDLSYSQTYDPSHYRYIDPFFRQRHDLQDRSLTRELQMRQQQFYRRYPYFGPSTYRERQRAANRDIRANWPD